MSRGIRPRRARRDPRPPGPLSALCPWCAAIVDPARAPRRPNALFCIACGHWSIYDQGVLHAPRLSERVGLSADPVARQVSRAWTWRHVGANREAEK